MASAPNETVQKIIGPEELASIYPEHGTRWRVYNQVVELVMNNFADTYTANHILRLGEPAVYGALQAYTEPLETIPEEAEITVESILQ